MRSDQISVSRRSLVSFTGEFTGGSNDEVVEDEAHSYRTDTEGPTRREKCKVPPPKRDTGVKKLPSFFVTTKSHTSRKRTIFPPSPLKVRETYNVDLGLQEVNPNKTRNFW